MTEVFEIWIIQCCIYFELVFIKISSQVIFVDVCASTLQHNDFTMPEIVGFAL